MANYRAKDIVEHRCVVMTDEGNTFLATCGEAPWPRRKTHYVILTTQGNLSESLRENILSIEEMDFGIGRKVVVLCPKANVTILSDDFPYNLEIV
jgi:hypothetical protein